MTADIVLYKTDVVPVGIDQAPHIEFAREIVRSFNYRYHTKVLIEPQVKHTEILKVLGIDGKEKMSKSLNNHIELASTPEETAASASRKWLPTRRVSNEQIRATLIFAMSSRCTRSSLRKDEVDHGQRRMPARGIGCVECKRFCQKLE